jgi:DNA-binding response OmpR family regulator
MSAIITHAEPARPVLPPLRTQESVLVVDDDPEMLMILEHTLTHEGYTVVAASSAGQAMERVRSRPIALVLLDWDLVRGKSRPDEPDTGSAVLRACREVNLLLPVIVMSGNQRLDARTDALMQNADSFLQKPFSVDMLARHVRFWMQRARGARATFRLSDEDDIIPCDELKRRYVRSVVALLGGNLSEAARRLQLHRHTVAALLAEPEPGETAQGQACMAPV